MFSATDCEEDKYHRYPLNQVIDRLKMPPIPKKLAFLLTMIQFHFQQSIVMAGGSLAECVPSSPEHEHFHCYPSGRYDSMEDSWDLACSDSNVGCPGWAKQGECRNNPRYMLLHCAKSCESCVNGHAGVVQIAPEEGLREAIAERVVKTQEYIMDRMETSVSYFNSCRNTHELCTYWAIKGDCVSNRQYMFENCAPACRSCTRS